MAFKDEVEAKRQIAKEKAETFEGEMLVGLERIKQAFSNLSS